MGYIRVGSAEGDVEDSGLRHVRVGPISVWMYVCAFCRRENPGDACPGCGSTERVRVPYPNPNDGWSLRAILQRLNKWRKGYLSPFRVYDSRELS